MRANPIEHAASSRFVHCAPKPLRVRQWAIIPSNEDPELEDWMVAGCLDVRTDRAFGCWSDAPEVVKP
jgi:hypothetical protein